MSAKRTFGQVSRLPSKRYRARYTGPHGALHSAPWTFETSGEAEAWLVDERRLISSGRWTPPKVRAEVAQRAEAARRSRVFGRYAQDWLEGRHDLRPSTRRSYQTALDRHLVPWFGDSPIDEITVIVRTPCRVRGGGKSKVRREPEVLTLPELLALAEAMPEHHRALTLLCGLCGLRFGEAVALRRRDLDLDRGLVHVTRTATKDGREKTVGAPKTAAGSRTVAMPQLVVDALRTHLAEQPVTGREALVFSGRDGELLAHSSLYGLPTRVEHRNGRTCRKEAFGFTRAREAIGKPTLNWHDLRRTAATLGAQAGATVREMQNRLGHATPAMALYYQGATAERDRVIADRLQETIEKAARADTVSSLPEHLGTS
jgi:integrase